MGREDEGTTQVLHVKELNVNTRLWHSVASGQRLQARKEERQQESDSLVFFTCVRGFRLPGSKTRCRSSLSPIYPHFSLRLNKTLNPVLTPGISLRLGPEDVACSAKSLQTSFYILLVNLPV